MSEFAKENSIKDVFLKLKEIWQFLLTKWKLIVLIGLLGGVVGLAYSIFENKKYKGELIFIVEEGSEKGSAGGLASLASSFGIDGASGNGLFSSINMLGLLKSRSLIEKTLLSPIDSLENKKLTFAQLYFEQYDLNKDEDLKEIHFRINEDRSKFSRLKDSVLYGIHLEISGKRLDVSHPDEENSFIFVTLKSKSELFSKRFPEKLLEIVSKYYIESKTKKALQNVNVIQKQVDSVRRELYDAMSGVASANDQIFGLNPSMNVQRVPAVKKQVNVQVNTALLGELIKNLELSKMTLLQQTPLVEIVDSPIYPLEVVKVRKVVGIIVGGILFGFFIVSFLLIKRFLKKVKQS